MASRWYELQNLSSTPSVVQSGTVFDNAASRAAARQYFIPVDHGDRPGTCRDRLHAWPAPIGATPAYTGRLAGDTLGTMTGSPRSAAVTSFGTTTANYNPPSDPGGSSGRRWGDYSFTSVDPLDDMTVWTIQEYNQASNSYAVRVGKLKAPPPATPTCTATPIPFTGPTGNVVINANSSCRLGILRSRRRPAVAGAALCAPFGDGQQRDRQQRDLQLADPGDPQYHRDDRRPAERDPDQSGRPECHRERMHQRAGPRRRPRRSARATASPRSIPAAT